MVRKKAPPSATVLPPAADLTAIVSKAIDDFKGNANELESAIGMLYLGHAFGWRVVYLLHSISTVRKYERYLGIVAKDVFPEVTALSERSLAFRFIKGASNFWKTVKGEAGHEREGVRDKSIVQG